MSLPEDNDPTCADAAPLEPSDAEGAVGEIVQPAVEAPAVAPVEEEPVEEAIDVVNASGDEESDSDDQARWVGVNCKTILIQVFHTFMPSRILMVESLHRTNDGCLVLRYWNHYNMDEVRTGPVEDHGFVYVELWQDRKNAPGNRREGFNIFKLDGWNYIRDPAAYYRAMEYIQTFTFEQYHAEGDQGQAPVA